MGGYRPGSAKPTVRGLNISITADQPLDVLRFSKTTVGMSTMDNLTLNASSTIDAPCGENEYIPLAILSAGAHGMYLGFEWELGSWEVKASESQARASVSVSPISEKLMQASGSNLTFPSVYFGTFNGDVDDGSNSLKEWFCK